jgi:hypothetical protein
MTFGDIDTWSHQNWEKSESDYFRTVQYNEYDQDPYVTEFWMNISDKLSCVEAQVRKSVW